MGETEKAINVSQLEELNEQLPDDEKKGNIGKVLNYILAAVKAGWSLKRAFLDVESLRDVKHYKKEVGQLFDKLIQENSQCNQKVEDKLAECANKWSVSSLWSSSDKCSDLKDILQRNAGNVEKVRDEVLNAIDEHHRSECNKVIQDMVKGSALIAAFYAVKLYIAWKKVSAASNVIKDKNKFRQIEYNIKELGEMVAGLVTICSTNPKNEGINDRMTLITSTYTVTLGLISDVRVKIDGHIQSLDLLGDVAAVDSAMSFATAAAHGYEVWSAWNNLERLTKGVGVATTAIFTFFGLANAYTVVVTRQQLKQLREDFNRVNSFKCELDELYTKARRAIAERIV